MTSPGARAILSADQVHDQRCGRDTRSSQQRFNGKLIEVWTDHVDLGGGEVVERDYLHHPGAVAIVALEDASPATPRMLMVRQYRHPVASLLWEIPAGLLDVPGETPLAAAQRELFEEAHLRADTWAVLTDFYNTPGCSDEKVRIFLARDLHEVPAGQRHVGVGEERDMPTGWLPLPEAVQAVTTGGVHNPAAVIGVLAAHLAWQSDWATLLPADHPWQQPGHHWGDHWRRRADWAAARA